jgi:hypothetical protein
MQILPETAQFLSPVKQALTFLKPGDLIAVRVLKRIAPFHYLVNYFGKQTQVASHVLLKPQDRILLQLQALKPRLEFKFVEILDDTANVPLQLAKSYGFQNSTLGLIYTEWALRLNLPLRRDEFKRLKRFYRINREIIKNPELLMIPLFWSASNLPGENFSNPLFLLDWLFGGKSLADGQADFLASEEYHTLDAEAKEKIDRFLNTTKQACSLDSLLRSISQKDFAVDELFSKNFMEEAADIEKLVRQQFTANLSGNKNLQLLRDICHFMTAQIYLFQKSKWVLLPLTSKNFEQHQYLLLKQSAINSKRQYDFLFTWHSRNFGENAISGKIIENQLGVKVFNSGQVLKDHAEKYIVRLRSKLGDIGISLNRFEVMEKQNVYQACSKIIGLEDSHNLEVFV